MTQKVMEHALKQRMDVKMPLNSSAPVKAVFFDCDGTLIDTIPLVVACKEYAFTMMGREVPPRDELIESIGIPIMDDIANYFEGEDQFRYLDFYQDFQKQHLYQQLGVFKEAYRTVFELWKKGIPLGVITSRRRQSTLELLEMFHMKQFFTVMVNPGDTELSKPHAEPLLEAVRRLNQTGMLSEAIRPEETVYVGDAHHDVGTANAANAKAVLVEWTNMPKHVLEDLDYDFTLYNHRQIIDDLGLS